MTFCWKAWENTCKGAESFEMTRQPVMQQDFLVSWSRGADFRVVINLRGCNFYWLLNRECAAGILRWCCWWTWIYNSGSGKWQQSFSEAGWTVSASSGGSEHFISSPCVQRTGAHGLWCFLTFYKVLELTSWLRDSISGQMSTPSLLWSEAVRAAETLVLEPWLGALSLSAPVPVLSLPFMLCILVCDFFCNCSAPFESWEGLWTLL